MLGTNEQTKQNQGYLLKSVSPADSTAVTELVNRISQAMSGLNEFTLTEVESFWKTPGLDMAEDVRLLAGPDGELLGYAEALTLQQPAVHPYIFFRMLPEAAGSPGAALLFDWAVQRCSRVLQTVGPDLRVSLSTHNLSGFAPLQNLFESRGFQVNRMSFTMEADLEQMPPAPEWPPGVQLQPFDMDRHMEKLYLAHDEAFTDHFGHLEQPLEQGLARFRHLMVDDPEGFDPSLWFIAMEGDEIAGYALCRKSAETEQPSGWITLLGVRRRWRKQGLGMALLHHSFAEFYKRGWRKAGLDVDAKQLDRRAQTLRTSGHACGPAL